MTRRSMLILAAICTGAVLLLSASAVVFHLQHTSEVPPAAGHADGSVPIDRGQGGPCSGSKRLSGPAQLSQTGVPALVPDDAAASTRNLRVTWSCAGGNSAALEYASGIEVTLDSGWTDVDASAKWAATVKDWGAGYVTDVNGTPAMAVPLSAEFPRGQVRFLSGTTLVSVLGNGEVPLKTLLRVATTIGRPN